MPTYISLCRYTQKGVENVKDSPTRLDAAKKLWKSMGAELKAFYLAMGQYDMVVIGEAPDGETMTKLALTIASKGALRCESFQVFKEDEYRKIINDLP